MNQYALYHSVKKKFVKRSSLRETLVLLENRNRKMFWPARNQEMTTGNSFIGMVSNSIWFNCLPGTLINRYSLRMRGQDVSHMLNWLKTLDPLIQVTRECYNNVCEWSLEISLAQSAGCLALTSFSSELRNGSSLHAGFLWLDLVFSSIFLYINLRLLCLRREPLWTLNTSYSRSRDQPRP